jgi:hypothetical protein
LSSVVRDEDCRYELRASLDAMSWRMLGHPYCERIAAIDDAQRMTRLWPVVEVIDRLTGQTIYKEARVVR